MLRWVLLLVTPWAMATPFSHPDALGICPIDPLAAALVTAPNPVGAAIQISALEGEADDLSAELVGEVTFFQNDQRITAQRARLDRQTDILTAEGEVLFADREYVLQAARASVDVGDRTGELAEVRYFASGSRAQGEAARAEIDSANRRSVFGQVTYSTCERSNEFWQLAAENLELDEASGRGKARNVTISIKQVPILYTPYLSFPLDDRRESGFLTPRIGYSNANGLDLRLPYYWNIAPNYDATITPRYISKRGGMASAEFRFLREKQQGEIEIEYLPNDRLQDRSRGSIYFNHRSRFFPNFYTDAVFRYVSDDNYVDDLGTAFQLVNPVALERRFDARYDGGNWNLLGRFQSFQTIDRVLFRDRERPYDRVPQVLFDGRFNVLNAGIRMRHELVYFDHSELTRGLRLDMHPSVELPFVAPYGFFTPRAGLRHTFYDLHGFTATQRDQGNTARTLPTASVDTGLIFERNAEFWGLGSVLQTLEPRLFYLYVPYKNQRRLPLFDTTKLDANYALLFAENRFTGADRVGDANQVTLALTSRLINPIDGREQFRISAGQIQYFANRRVFLTDRVPEKDGRSDLITEIVFSPNPTLTFLSTVYWNMRDSAFPRRTFNVRYQPDNQRLLNAAYYAAPRDRDDIESRRLEQLDFSGAWPLSPQWRLVGRLNYSLAQERSVDTLAGFEYQDCCWALRMVGRRFREKPQDADARNEIYLELELKGLAGIGNRIDRILQDAILGYQPVSREF